MGSYLWVQKSLGGKRRETKKCFGKKCPTAQRAAGTTLRQLRGRPPGARGTSSYGAVTVLQGGWEGLCFIRQLRTGGEEVWAAGALPRDLLRARRARVPPGDSKRRSAPLPSPPPRPVCVLPPLHSSGWTEPQREPRLSPGSLSPERSPSLSVTAVCAFLFFFFPPPSSSSLHPRFCLCPA